MNSDNNIGKILIYTALSKEKHIGIIVGHGRHENRYNVLWTNCDGEKNRNLFQMDFIYKNHDCEILQ